MTKEIRSKANDLKFGDQKEIETIDKIKEYWLDDSIVDTKTKYNSRFYKWDFESETTATTWELKSRRCCKNKYETTIIPSHKILSTTNKQIFIFNFTDGYCYIEYDPEKFAKYNRKMIRCFRFGASSKPVEHIEIPIEDLVDMNFISANPQSCA